MGKKVTYICDKCGHQTDIDHNFTYIEFVKGDSVLYQRLLCDNCIDDIKLWVNDSGSYFETKKRLIDKIKQKIDDSQVKILAEAENIDDDPFRLGQLSALEGMRDFIKCVEKV